MQKVIANGLFLPALFWGISCGKNTFESLNTPPPEVKASLALESQKPDKAVNDLLANLGAEFKDEYILILSLSSVTEAKARTVSLVQRTIGAGQVNNASNLISILASAKAQQHGLDPLNIALKLANNSGSAASSSGSSSPITMLFPALPEASLDNIRGLDIAIALISGIGTYKTQTDLYKEAIYITSAISLSAKALDLDGDGTISAEEALSLSDEAAEAILDQLVSAAIAASGSTEGADSNSAKSASQIASIQNQINAQEGETQAEKLRALLAKTNAP
jgi:hypothetical protein